MLDDDEETELKELSELLLDELSVLSDEKLELDTLDALLDELTELELSVLDDDEDTLLDELELTELEDSEDAVLLDEELPELAELTVLELNVLDENELRDCDELDDNDDSELALLELTASGIVGPPPSSSNGIAH